MKLRLIALMLSGLLLAAPTMREPAECAEIAPEPPAVNTEGLRVQPTAAETERRDVGIAPYEAEAEAQPEKAPSETGEGHPGGTGSHPEIASGDQPDGSTSAEVRAIWEDVPLSAELQAALLAICEEAGVDPLLALGLIQTESNFQPDAVSRTGDYGLCQLNHLYFPTDLTPEENMRRGIGYLAELLKRYGSTETALTAYHIGHDDGTRYYAGVVLGHARAWGYGA